MATKVRWTLGVRSDLAVIGNNWENADYTNPRGEIIGERFYLIATAQNGERRRWGWFETEAAAEGWLAFAPSVEDWDDTYPEYGSPAYEDAEPELVYQEKVDALEWEASNRCDWLPF